MNNNININVNPSLVPGDFITISSSGSYTTASWVDTNEEKFKEVSNRLERIEERLVILSPNFELHDQFPALKEAYEHYKVIEALVKNHGTK